MDAASVYVFSDFSFEVETGTLERNGHPTRLNSQATLCLTRLLESHGRVVSREELQDALWTGGVSVDFNQGINRTISSLRQTLRDDPQKPRFIQTIPKRGYRFCVPVHSAVHPLPAQPTTEVAQQTTALIAKALEPSEISLVPSPVPVISNAKGSRVRFLPGWPSALLTSEYSLVALMLVMLVCAVIFFGRSGVAAAPGSAPETLDVALRLRTDSPDLRAATAQLQQRLAEDLSGVPHVLLLLPAHDGAAQPIARAGISLDGTVQRQGDYLYLSLKTRDMAGRLVTLSYRTHADQISILHRELLLDVFSKYIYPATASFAEDRRPASIGGTRDLEAYREFVQSLPLITRRTDESLSQAVHDLRDATRRDPAFTQATARLSMAVMLQNYARADSSAETSKTAERLAEAAVTANPDLAEAHAVLGFQAAHDHWEFARAERELNTALRLDSDNTPVRSWLAVLLAEEGESAAALNQIHVALQQAPESACLRHNEILILEISGDYRRMLTAAVRNLEEHRRSPAANDQAGWAYWYNGMFQQAVASWKTEYELSGDTTAAAAEATGLQVVRRNGSSAYARFKAESILAGRFNDSPGDANDLAQWYALANERQAALSTLEASLKEHSPAILNVGSNPALRSLRDEPRYQAVLHAVSISHSTPAFERPLDDPMALATGTSHD